MNVKSQTTLSYAYMLDGVSYNNTASSNIATVEVRTTNLLVKKFTNTDYCCPQDIISCCLVVTNPGNYPALNVSISDVLENQVLLDESFKYDFLDNKKNNCEVILKKHNDNPVFIIPVISQNDVCVIRYKTKVKEELPLDDLVCSKTVISSNEVKEFTLEENKIKQGYAKIICHKKALADFTYINNDLSYLISVKNVGNIEATNLEIVDLLPETFKINDEGVTLDDVFLTYNLEDNFLKFQIPNLKANEEALVYINGKIVN